MPDDKAATGPPRCANRFSNAPDTWFAALEGFELDVLDGITDPESASLIFYRMKQCYWSCGIGEERVENYIYVSQKDSLNVIDVRSISFQIQRSRGCSYHDLCIYYPSHNYPFHYRYKYD